MAVKKPIVNYGGEFSVIESGDVIDVATGGTGLSTLTTGSFLKALNSSTFTLRTPAEVLSDIGALAASSYTASDVLGKLLTVDGTGSGLDADLLDGQQGSYYLDAGNLTGNLSDARLSSNVLLKNVHNQVSAGISGTTGSGNTHASFLGGGAFRTATASVTGAIQITLPTAVGWNNSMLSFWVDIFDYVSGGSLSAYVAGYTYAGTGSGGYWVNCTAVIYTNDLTNNFTVRFGGTATNPMVYIGELASAWSYPGIAIRDLQISTSASAASSGWSIGHQSTAFSTPPGGAIVSITSALPLTSRLATARTIGISGPITGTATSFDGTANITIPVTALNVGHANVTGTLAVNRGGTGIASYTVGNYIRASAATTLEQRAPASVLVDILGSRRAMSAHENSVISSDTRSVNDEPDDRDRGVYWDFKLNTTTGLADGGTYHGIQTFRPYGNTTDFSGGPAHQMGFTTNGNVFHRISTSATTWGTWNKLWHSGNDGSGSGLDADLLDGQDGSYYLNYANLTGVPSTFTPSAHTHVIADVTGLQTALDGKASTTHNHTLDSLSNVTISSNTAGEILKWTGTSWINNTLAEAGIQPAGSYLTANETITLSGDLSGSGSTSISASIVNGAVTLAKMANVATGTVFYRKTAGTGSPEVQTLATLKTDLGLSGTNTGDQTITLTGDVTGSGTGTFAATIANNAVTLAKMADIASARILGRVTASTGDPEALTGTQVTTLLDVFTTSLKGLVPASGGGTANFLRADGSWVPPPVGGGGTWGSITGTLSNQTDLQNALDARTIFYIQDTAPSNPASGAKVRWLDSSSGIIYTWYTDGDSSQWVEFTSTVVRDAAQDILNRLLTVDGAGSGLDSDLLDGQNGSYYLDAANLTGSLADARLSANVPLINVANTFTASQTVGVASGTGDWRIEVAGSLAGGIFADGASPRVGVYGSVLGSTIVLRPNGRDSTSNQVSLYSSGALDVGGAIRSTSEDNGASYAGAGAELYYSVPADAGYLIAYNRTTSVWKPLRVYGSTVNLFAAGTLTATVSTTGLNVVGSVADSGGNVRNPRVQTVASSATVTPNADTDDLVAITAQAAALTIANATGTPVQGQKLLIRIKDNGTARAITFGTNYRAMGVALPTTTTANKTMYLGFIWNATDSKWDLIALTQEA